MVLNGSYQTICDWEIVSSTRQYGLHQLVNLFQAYLDKKMHEMNVYMHYQLMQDNRIVLYLCIPFQMMIRASCGWIESTRGVCVVVWTTLGIYGVNI